MLVLSVVAVTRMWFRGYGILLLLLLLLLPLELQRIVGLYFAAL